MAYDRIKRGARRLGVYPAARWFNRHVLHRDELRTLRSDQRFYRQFIAPKSLCFDVGANFGIKTEAFLRLHARVVAFEPQEDCVEELRARLGSRRDLQIVNAAVGAAPGRMRFFVSPHRTASSAVPHWQGEVAREVEVPVTTLDDAIREFGPPDFCKIDVEGYELEVLRGLTRALPVVSFEYHIRESGLKRARACLDRLATFGQIRVNVTAGERASFLLDKWCSPDDFGEYMERILPSVNEQGYGDIFVITNPKIK